MIHKKKIDKKKFDLHLTHKTAIAVDLTDF